MSSLNAPCLHVAHIRYTDDVQAILSLAYCAKAERLRLLDAWEALG